MKGVGGLLALCSYPLRVFSDPSGDRLGPGWESELELEWG